MADALIEYETLTSEQLDDIMVGAKPRQPKDVPPPSAGPSGEEKAPSGKSPKSPIGGPAPEA